MRLKSVSVRDPLYYSKITCLIGGQIGDVRKYLMRIHGNETVVYNKDLECTKDLEDSEKDGLQFHTNGETETFYVWIKTQNMDSLAHEVFHLTCDLFYARGIEYSDNAEEAFTYWHANIFTQLCDKLFTYTPKKI